MHYSVCVSTNVFVEHRLDDNRNRPSKSWRQSSNKQLSVEINPKNTSIYMAVRLFIHINSVYMENNATGCLS